MAVERETTKTSLPDNPFDMATLGWIEVGHHTVDYKWEAFVSRLLLLKDDPDDIPFIHVIRIGDDRTVSFDAKVKLEFPEYLEPCDKMGGYETLAFRRKINSIGSRELLSKDTIWNDAVRIWNNYHPENKVDPSVQMPNYKGLEDRERFHREWFEEGKIIYSPDTFRW